MSTPHNSATRVDSDLQPSKGAWLGSTGNAPAHSWILDVLDELLSVFLHEARGPLTAINGWAQVLELSALGQDVVTEVSTNLKTAVTEQSALFQTMDDLLAVARGHVLERAHVELTGLLSQLYEQIRPNAEARGVKFERHREQSKVYVEGDSQRLDRVILSRLSDSIARSPGGGNVSVELANDGHAVSLHISDQGPRLTTQAPPCPFERLQRAGGSRSRRSTDIDLHLAYARVIIEDYGGSVAASSPDCGDGAHFTFIMPVAPVTEAGQTIAHESPERVLA